MTQARSHVQDIVDLNVYLQCPNITNIEKECIEGVQDSIRKNLWEKAAAYIQRYLEIDASLLDESSKATLDKSEKELNQVVQSKLATALEHMEFEEIYR